MNTKKIISLEVNGAQFIRIGAHYFISLSTKESKTIQLTCLDEPMFRESKFFKSRWGNYKEEDLKTFIGKVVNFSGTLKGKEYYFVKNFSVGAIEEVKQEPKIEKEIKEEPKEEPKEEVKEEPKIESVQMNVPTTTNSRGRCICTLCHQMVKAGGHSLTSCKVGKVKVESN